MGEPDDESPVAAGGYRLAGITGAAEEVPIRTLLDGGWPDYDKPQDLLDRMVDNYRAFVRWQIEHRKMSVERFTAGRRDQIVLRHAPKPYPKFEIRNIAADGHVWTGTGDEVRNRFPDFDPPSENNCSTAFRLRYGRFTYFNGGDMAGIKQPQWRDLESAVAWVAGPVDVLALNHHGPYESH